MSTRHAAGLVVAVVTSVALAGCGQTATGPTGSASASTAGDAGCQVVTADGQTSNADVQRLATSLFESLDCEGPTPLTAQLRAAGKDPSFEKEVKAAGAVLSVTEAAGAVQAGIVFTSTSSGCTVLAMDTPKGKTLNCGDV